MPVPRDGDTGTPTLIGLTLTDSNGRFTLEMIEPGTYYVMAGRIDAPSYYPGVNALSSAKSILVTAGARVSGIDFRTVQPLIHSLSGRVVLQPEQKLPPGARMMLSGATPATAEAPISADGAFEFNRIQPGQYTLRLSSDPFSAPRPVTVEGRVTGLEFRLPPISLNGSVVTEGNSEAPTVSVTFMDVKQGRAIAIAGRVSFSVFVPEGEFRVAATRVPNGYEVKSLMAGDVDLLSNTLKLSSAAPAVGIALTLKASPTVAFIGKAVSQPGVLLPVRSIQMERAGAQPFQGAIQPDGSFTFEKIPPGEYTAVILGSGFDERKMKVSIPPGGKRDAEIVIPALRQLSVKLAVESNVPAAASTLVTLRFIEANGDIAPLVLDGSSGGTPLNFSLYEGQYRVTATVREASAGAERTRVKALTSGSVNLLTTPLSVGDRVEEIRITVGR
jgi:hypothetical protein